jgi:peptidoglycan/xylan/chitin deacetylase (PgdA/CDA1 family)
VCLASGKTAAEGTFAVAAGTREHADAFTARTGLAIEDTRLATRIFEIDSRPGDEVLLREAARGLPLVVRRGTDVIVACDVAATQTFYVTDSKRPIYTYIPGFNIQKVPAAIRRPVSNLAQAVRRPKQVNVVDKYSTLPLTSFESVLFFLNTVLANGATDAGPLRWPTGQRAVFVSLHDVDTSGFLRRRERDPLLRIEQKHGIKSTWFVPTGLLRRGKATVDFLLESGNEVGWHGHSHDHRLPFPPYADRRVEILRTSCLSGPENYPTGMRTPRLLKSNYLFELLERRCPALCYDTSVLHGIAPYYLWLNGRQSSILEIPTTVPTDILVYNQLRGVSRARRADMILKAQIARTQKLAAAGGLISIVTHPEKDLSERPDFLDAYDQYLAFIKGQPDIWFATAGELFKYWTGRQVQAAVPA